MTKLVAIVKCVYAKVLSPIQGKCRFKGEFFIFFKSKEFEGFNVTFFSIKYILKFCQILECFSETLHNRFI